MSTRQITLSELSEPVRAFLSQVNDGLGMVISDEAGRIRYGVIAYNEPPREVREKALENLRRLQEHTAKAMSEQGVTEDDLDELLRDD